MAEEGYQQTLSPQVLSQINAHLRQVRASGRSVTDADIRAAYAAALDVEAGRALQNRGQAIQQEQWQKTYELQKEALADQRDAARMTGIATIGSALWQMGGKEAIMGGINKLKPAIGLGGAQNQSPTGSATIFSGTTPTTVPVTTPTGVPTGMADAATPSHMVPSTGTPAVTGGGAAGSGAMDFAKDWVLPGAVGAGIGAGVKALTGSTGWGVGIGAGVGAVGGYLTNEGDIASGIVGGLLGGVGGLF